MNMYDGGKGLKDIFKTASHPNRTDLKKKNLVVL